MKKRKVPSQAELTRSRWLRGRLDYKLHAGQMLIETAVNASQNQLFVGELARQFGKTYWLVKKALETAFKKKRAKIKIGTAFQTDLLEFILPAFDIVMQDCPEDLKPVWKSQRSKFILPHNGSEIKLVGLDRKPNGMRGTVIDLIILDEAGFMSRLDYLYKSVIIPATTHRPNCRILVFSTPPDTPAHEFIDYVQKAEYEGGYLKLTIYDNPLVNQTTIVRLMKESGGPNSTTWRREYLCEHVTDANLQIISDWTDEYLEDVLRDPYYGFYHKYEAMDLGVRDHTATIFGYYHFKKAALVMEDEYTIFGSKMNTKILQANLKRKELEVWSSGHDIQMEEDYIYSESDIKKIEEHWEIHRPTVYRRVSDNNNLLMNQDLSHLHQLHFSPTDKGRLEEMVNTVKIMVRSGGIIVHPRCKQLKGCLKYGVWDKNRDKFAQSKVYGHFDALAALIYLVRNLNRTTNPIPPDFQLDQSNQILFTHKQESQSVRNLKGAFGFKR